MKTPSRQSIIFQPVRIFAIMLFITASLWMDLCLTETKNVSTQIGIIDDIVTFSSMIITYGEDKIPSNSLVHIITSVGGNNA